MIGWVNLGNHRCQKINSLLLASCEHLLRLGKQKYFNETMSGIFATQQKEILGVSGNQQTIFYGPMTETLPNSSMDF